MLQLGGTLVCSGARTTSRLSWWFTAQNLLYASSAQTIAAAAAASTPLEAEPAAKELATEEKVENLVDRQRRDKYAKKQFNPNRQLLTATFKSLSITSENEESAELKELGVKVKDAKTIDEILAVTDDPGFNQKQAAVIVPVMYNWISEQKITVKDLQAKTKFWKAYNTLGLKDKEIFRKREYNPPRMSSSFQGENISKLNSYQMITVLSKLANRQERVTPLLQELTDKIADSINILNIKLLADILYSVSKLNFYNSFLMEKISAALIKVIPANETSAVIGSISRSLGVLRYRDEALLNALSEWVVEHHKIIRPQEIHSLLMTLAFLGFTPVNMSKLMEQIMIPLKESDMCNSNEWLDVVWALTILNHATPKQYESVLNDEFLSRLFDLSDYSIPKSLKILNINAGARLLPDYKGPVLPENSSIFDTSISCSKEKRIVSNSVTSALKILSPSNSIQLNVNTKMGFLLDAEFCVDSKCSPVPMNTKPTKGKEVLRIAVLTCGYHDFCKGVAEIIGPVKFYSKLLQQQGYKVMIVPYTDVNTKDKLIQRVQYINDKMKNLVQVTSQ